MYIIWWSTAATDRATLFPPAACCWLLLDSEHCSPEVVTEMEQSSQIQGVQSTSYCSAPVNSCWFQISDLLTICLCPILALHTLISLWTSSKRFYFHKIYCLLLSMNSHDNADSSISPCCGNVKNCHFSGVLPDGNWKYGKFAALLHNTSAVDYSWYCQFLCISSVSVQWDVNIAK